MLYATQSYEDNALGIDVETQHQKQINSKCAVQVALLEQERVANVC